ncbi:MAG: hypothetical protein KF805_03550 [Phycisphaeraceae bacterium]|nr:hypothetical protein [Phycisphaeraceae bacterium]
MRSDTISMLNDFTAEQLLWVAIRSNANMRAKVMQVIETRAREGLPVRLAGRGRSPGSRSQRLMVQG